MCSAINFLRRNVGCAALCLFFQVAWAQGPYPLPSGWETDGQLLLTNENPARRHDWCARQREVAMGNVKLRDALQGSNVSIMVNLLEWGPWDGKFGVCEDEKELGCVFQGAVLDELARRAGFEYRHTFSYGDSRNAENYKAWMLWVAENYDLGLGLATETADRLADGLVWNAYLADNSFVLATRKVVETPSLFATLFQFLLPFSWQIWLVLILGGFLSSVLYVITERHANPSDLPPGTFFEQLADSFMLACFQFVNAGGYTPKTAAGRGITLTWGLTTLFTVSAYTANLATFLISQESAGFQLQSIDEANSAGAFICHRKGWAIERYLATHYPRVARVPVESQAEAWEALRDGRCVAEAMYVAGFRVEEVKKSYNPVCEMSLTPALPFSAQSGGWYSRSDNGFLCTGLVKDVFQLHMSEMVVDGRIEKFFQDYIEVGAAQDPRGFACSEEEQGAGGGEISQMGWENMGGVYIIHGALTIMAALTILEICMWRKAHGQSVHGQSVHGPLSQPPTGTSFGKTATVRCSEDSGGRFSPLSHDEKQPQLAQVGQAEPLAPGGEVQRRLGRLEERLEEVARAQAQQHAELHALLVAALQHETPRPGPLPVPVPSTAPAPAARRAWPSASGSHSGRPDSEGSEAAVAPGGSVRGLQPPALSSLPLLQGASREGISVSGSQVVILGGPAHCPSHGRALPRHPPAAATGSSELEPEEAELGPVDAAAASLRGADTEELGRGVAALARGGLPVHGASFRLVSEWQGPGRHGNLNGGTRAQRSSSSGAGGLPADRPPEVMRRMEAEFGGGQEARQGAEESRS